MFCGENILNKKWNESGFRPPLCTYRLNWARRTSWGWWYDWDDTVLQTQDSKFEPWRSEAEHATSRSRRLPTILTFTRGWGRNIFVFFKPPRPGNKPRTLAWKAAVLTTTLGPPPKTFLIPVWLFIIYIYIIYIYYFLKFYNELNSLNSDVKIRHVLLSHQWSSSSIIINIRLCGWMVWKMEIAFQLIQNQIPI